MSTAVVYGEHGGPQVLRPTRVERPVPGPGQVSVAVRAAGGNPIDCEHRSGFGAIAPPDRPMRLGVHVAGVIDAVGPDGTGRAVGDEVFGRATDGAYAEYALCAADDLVAKPAEPPWDVAAGLEITVETAVRTLRRLGVTDTDTVLVHDASGGVGAMATQLAAPRGARVIGTAGRANQELVRSFGAEPVEYGDGWPDRVPAVAPDGVDAVLDVPGRGVLPDSIAPAGGPDRVVTIADPAAERFGVHHSRGLVTRLGLAEVCGEVLPLIIAGRLRVVIGGRYPLDEVVAAHRLGEAAVPADG